MKPSLRAFTRPADPPASAVQSNLSKPIQTNPSKITWFCLVLFVRIGTFQWVTATELRERFDTVMRASTLVRGTGEIASRLVSGRM